MDTRRYISSIGDPTNDLKLVVHRAYFPVCVDADWCVIVMWKACVAWYVGRFHFSSPQIDTIKYLLGLIPTEMSLPTMGDSFLVSTLGGSVREMKEEM